MNHRKIVFNILAIVATLTLLVPLFNFVATVMNLESDLAYFGPVIAFLGAFIVGSVVTSLSIKSYNQLKSSDICQTKQKVTGKSSKKNVKSKIKNNN